MLNNFQTKFGNSTQSASLLSLARSNFYSFLESRQIRQNIVMLRCTFSKIIASPDPSTNFEFNIKKTFISKMNKTKFGIRWRIRTAENLYAITMNLFTAQWASYVVGGITHLKVWFLLDLAKSQIARKN